MPTWGLTAEMLEADETPWGLPRELLAPAKTQTDPVHQDIYWIEIERLIIDSRALQRLRHVKQLGSTLKVYPGAEHSRFTHSLGTLRSAQDILDRIASNRSGPHAVPSLLDEWEEDADFQIRFAEATVLARLAALLHDIGHVPFGHTIEDDLAALTRHDQNEERFDRLWGALPEKVRKAIGKATTQRPIEGRETGLYVELRSIVLDKVVMAAGWKRLYPFVADVVNNTICADLLDYLQRDHYFTGLPIAVGDRFMDNFYVAPSEAKSMYAERLIVRVNRAGESRIDVVTELLKYLRYRYEATERALYHKTKLAFDAMLGKLLEMWRDAIWHREALKIFPELGTHENALRAEWLREQVHDLSRERRVSKDACADVTARSDKLLEEYFEFFGDEGLLEHLIWTLRGEDDLDERWRGILELAERLRYREHFRMIAHAGGREVVPAAADKFNKFGSADERRKLERGAARWAGVDPGWKVVLWIPGPDMRLKLAKVLIEDRGMISTLEDRYDDARKIAARHRELWATRVYAPSEIRDDYRTRDRLLSYLYDEMQLPFVTPDGRPVLPSNRLAAEEVALRRGLGRDKVVRIEQRLDEGVAARAEEATFEDLLTIAEGIADNL